ncbi:MAG: hypothetical protein AAGB27_01430 [Pseudomonadota bacterium]
MKLKRYFGPDARTVMRQIKREQGGDAVIISCNAAGDGTEIVTQIKDGPDLAQAAANAVMSAAPAPSGGSDLALAEMESMRRELRSMHGLLDESLSQLAGRDLAQREPIAAACSGYLTSCGISRSVSESLLKNLEEGGIRATWHEVLVRLARKIPVTNNNILNQGGRILLAGPQGMGKTAAIAKLATRYLLAHGADQIALITTDCTKIGACAQLERIAQLLQVPLSIARSSGQLREQLEHHADKSLVLVDSPGISIHGERGIEQLKAYAQISSLQPHLVLSAALAPAIFNQALTRFSLLDPKGVILSHAEQLEHVGPLISTLVERRIAVSYLSTGPRIPEDLRPARAAQLAAGALSPATRKLIATQTREQASA